jgi:hypothetical protein
LLDTTPQRDYFGGSQKSTVSGLIKRGMQLRHATWDLFV